MQLSTLLLGATALLTAGALASPVHQRRNGSSSARPKVIMDNDWNTDSFLEYLVAMDAGWDVLGLTSCTADTWALQSGLHALATLDVGGLAGCVPVYRGADYPLLNTPELFQAWEAVHGKLAWEGAFAAENATAEAEGSDPTSGDPDRVVRAAFPEGVPNTTFAGDDGATSAAEFMVAQVRRHPGEVSIWAAGALTNVALAVRMDASFARNARQLVIMGGYIDDNLLQTTGSVTQADISSDINLMIDPEAAKIALTAAFPNITVVGNAANQVFPTRAWLDEAAGVAGAYTALLNRTYTLEFPFWDPASVAVLVEPEIVTNATRFYLDVDTSYASPSYGNIHAYQEALAPAAQRLVEVRYPHELDGERVKEMIMHAVQYPPTCADLGRA
ncbi:Inosine/uridine-preferring nucleoside hydrolase domain-containing protein [Xylariaceae sp. FL0804]|nr:Inosine/uridine-preferring nucleoside hydrolase domain-containing protein [Xylariaceae sp. FL0804]